MSLGRGVEACQLSCHYFFSCHGWGGRDAGQQCGCCGALDSPSHSHYCALVWKKRRYRHFLYFLHLLTAPLQLSAWRRIHHCLMKMYLRLNSLALHLLLLLLMGCNRRRRERRERAEHLCAPGAALVQPGCSPGAARGGAARYARWNTIEVNRRLKGF
jgi:hypothetical protein